MDRNQGPGFIRHGVRMSLSARRAWIEMRKGRDATRLFSVALRKESVDRNVKDDNICIGAGKSLSARRAWIEMSLLFLKPAPIRVALRKESVDRNRYIYAHRQNAACRSPQGERG